MIRRLLIGLLGGLALLIPTLALMVVLSEWGLRQRIFHISPARPRNWLDALVVDSELLSRPGPRGRRWVPGAHVMLYNHPLNGRDIELRINARGHRDDESRPGAHRGYRRILALGDSITAGDYLAHEELWTEVLEADLSRRWRSPRLEVVNTAIGNIGLEDELAILAENRHLQPDLVILAHYLNDAQPSERVLWQRGSSGVARHSLLVQAGLNLELLIGLTLNYRMPRQPARPRTWSPPPSDLDWRNDPEDLRALASLRQHDWGSAWTDSHWTSIAAGFDRLSALSHRDGFDVLIAMFPVLYQVEANFVEDSPQRRVAELAKQRDFGFVDLLPTLRATRAGPSFLDHCHFDERGHAIVARALSDWIDAWRTRRTNHARRSFEEKSLRDPSRSLRER